MEPGKGRQFDEPSENSPVNELGESDSRPHAVAKTDGGNTNDSLPSVSLDEFTRLTGFQRDILYVISGLETPKGLEIKDELEEVYEDDINHGRLYPNLDTVAEYRLIDKIDLDGRSNGYELTQTGQACLHAWNHWVQERLSHGEVTQSTDTVNSSEEPSDETEPSDDTADAETSQPHDDGSNLQIHQRLKKDLEDLSVDSAENRE